MDLSRFTHVEDSEAPGGDRSDLDQALMGLPFPVWVDAEVARVEDKESQAGGRYTSIAYKLLEGPAKGAWVWDTYVFMHPKSERAVQVGVSRLRKVREAIRGPMDTTKWVGNHLSLKLARKEAEG